MGKVKNLIAGFAGAVALNILHETLKHKSNNVPRIDLLGENALQKTLGFFGERIGDKDTLYKATLAGDVISNALYYSLIGAGSKDHVWTRAISYGLAAGVGAVTLPKPLGLDPEPVSKTQKTQLLTIAYYVVGAIVTGGIIKALAKSEQD